MAAAQADQKSPSPHPGPAEPSRLVHTCVERLEPKDFVAEVRAQMDVAQFVERPELLLDFEARSPGQLLEAGLEKIFASERAGARGQEEARQTLLVAGSAGTVSRSIQGLSAAGAGSCDLAREPTWIVCSCEAAQVSRRHLLLARLKEPLNFGPQAEQVRLVGLVVVPTSEKGTKNGLETARTFATLLADEQFRQCLLEARGDTFIKSLFLQRCQQLSGEPMPRILKHHHYLIEAAELMGAESCQPPPTTTTAAEDSLRRRSLDWLANGHLFGKNPRGSKLFELISPQSMANGVTIAACDPGTPNGKGYLDVEEARKGAAGGGGGGGCCGLMGVLSQAEFGVGLLEDFKRRLRYYPSDFRDAFVGPPKTVQKTITTTWFLYFGILLPTIAFSSLNTTQTNGHMGELRKAIIGQAIGGLGFALFGGQPLVIIMTTAPLCLYTKVIYDMCISNGYNFLAMYAAVGLWNGFFLIMYSVFGFSVLMKWCTRSIEEIFAMFIVIAFITDATKDMAEEFHKYYFTPACQSSLEKEPNLFSLDLRSAGENNLTTTSHPMIPVSDELEFSPVCRKEVCLLFVLLMLGTVWLAMFLYRFNKTPYLSSSAREFFHDYALPAAVLFMSFVGSRVFSDIRVGERITLGEVKFERALVESLPLSGVLLSACLGFTLSLLFFMDQNISAAMVNAPQNSLKKGCAYHFDLLVVALLNGFLTLYGLPMMHGVLPHSPLHARSLADIEERLEEGHVTEVITNVRETRVTAAISHLILLASLVLIPDPIAYIPRAVMDGLFLYMAVTSLDGLVIFERLMLLFTEQNKYPPNHYVRRCPQGEMHKFTFLQLLQLLVMVIFGFSPWNSMQMFFPVIILLMIPFRYKIIPKFINEKYLNVLDGKH